MPNMVDGKVNKLLCQAEERLEISFSASKHAQSSSAVKTLGNVHAGRSKEENLSIRQPQTQSFTAKRNKNTAGSEWFDLPKTALTPEFKREWQLLRMRSVLDPKHQKKALRAAVPEYSQVGEVIAGPTDFFSARLTKRDRKATLSGEMIGAVDGQKLRTKYAGIQRTKASGKKAFYQRLVSKRRRK
ncbi:rrna-processing protein fcf2 [Metarhizium acridum]|uniref:rrna-processing protein fcf2 n=1 Tax=Metarhizium acridum TaxID=92637 RepID=UPI001C6B23DB|nr:rrna-processing protein fcf2 [Metarhizium acridum]